MPVFLLPVGVLEREGEDGAALFDGVFTLFVVLKGVGEQVEGGGGGPSVWCRVVLAWPLGGLDWMEGLG